MTPIEIAKRLIKLDKSKRDSALAEGIDLYLKILLNIANDIYKSCIADYYAGYTPIYYDRHKNIEGINLYSARNNKYSNFYVSISLDEDKLEPYRGKASKSSVFNQVVSGWRGTGMRASQSEWPMPWSTSYPNSYSTHRIWYSKGSTIEEILTDFLENVTKDTSDILWQCIERQI